MLSEGRSKRKPTKLSDEGAKNNLLIHSDNTLLVEYYKALKPSAMEASLMHRPMPEGRIQR